MTVMDSLAGMKVCRLILFAFVIGPSIIDDYVSAASDCIISVVSFPPQHYIQHIENRKYRMECVFRSTCRPKFAFEFNRLTYDNKYRPIFSDYYTKNLSLSFQTEAWNSGKNEYTSALIVDPFKPHFGGIYKCIAMDSKNPAIRKERPFRFNVVELSFFPLHAQCFLPHVTDIEASPQLIDGGSISIYLQWQLTEKEDEKLAYCIGSRMWRVRILKYPSATVAPFDYEVKNSSVQWINVSDQNTNHSFTEILLTDVYYSFQVVHRGEFSYSERTQYNLKPITFASKIYYYGKQMSTSISKPPDSTYTLPVGSTRSVYCDAGGVPRPDVKWIRESGGPLTVRQNDSATLELNHLTKDDAGVYYCVAFNVLVNPPNGRREEGDTWKITVIVEDEVPVDGFTCRTLSFDSSICKSYIYTGLTIYTNHSMNESMIQREDRAVNLTSTINFAIPLGVCRNLAYSMMCHNVYPYCDVLPGIPTPRKLCNKVCQEFASGQCKNYLSKDSTLYKMLIEGCDSRDYTGGQAPECIPLSSQTYRQDQFEVIKDTGDCVRGDGRGYSGNQYRTESRALCQSWDKQTPHSHPMLPELYRTDLDQAHFSCRNPGGIGNKPWCYTVDPSVRWEYCSIPNCDSCEIYVGTTCKSLAGYTSMNVTVTRDGPIQSQEDIEEKISLFSKSVLFLQPTDGCKNILTVLLCHGAFPQCTETSSKKLCSIYCQFDQTLKNLCPDVYTEFLVFTNSNQHFINTANCSLNDEEQCMMIPELGYLPNDDRAVWTNNCYEGNGIMYNGSISQTRDGVLCQAWDTQQPHSHPITPARYPELQNSKNYCRNPGNLKEKPWCYTTDTNKVWDYCKIELCNDVPSMAVPIITNTVTHETSSAFTNVNNSSLIVTIGSVFGVLLVVLIAILVISTCVIGWCYLRQKNKRIDRETILNRFATGLSFVSNTDYVTDFTTNGLSIPDNFKLLDSKDIKYVHQLGQGNFGIVFKGMAFSIKEEGIDVAVKTLKETANSEIKKDFIEEAKLMFMFDHPNILKIHGVCMSEMPYQLVFEYMDEGDLTKFLRSRASSQQRRLVNPFRYRSRTESSYSDDPASLAKTQLLYICKQIADGMQYLAENNHVHRDLACRNCLVKSDLVVKIGDFGMSRNLYSKDYYRINGNAVLPVRWMSPESLIYGKFSVESDVWSFGVVMWEVFSFALQPYYGITNDEVTEIIRKGKTLNCPDGCPLEVYDLMKECWAMDSVDRITFSELYSELCKLHHSSSVSGSPDEKSKDNLSITISDSSSSDSCSDDAFYPDDNTQV